MALLRKLNRILLGLLIFMVYIILYSRMYRAPSPPSHTDVRAEPGVVGGAAGGAVGGAKGGAAEEEVSEVEAGDILVVICAAEERMGGAMATVNSVRSNTEASVFFYIVTLHDNVAYVRQYIQKSELKDIRFKILEFNPTVLKGKVRPDSSRPELLHPLNFVRFYLPLLVKHRRAIYLDDDVIVQGDIQELYNTKLKPGHAAAFASDCDLPSEVVRTMGMQTTYMGFLDYRKLEVRELGINPSDCSFNPGVFVADMEMWKRQKITKQLETWMQQNYKNNLYSSAMSGGVATPPMLIVFHGKYTALDPMWHVGHLGWSPDTQYSDASLHEAQLLHWSGRFKPWDYPCVHMELWEKWYIPDPSRRFSLVRPNS
ncbi:glycosyltransferase 8 domain-containing protein 2 isoform X1 [Anguilla anguilla]|uniref:glycosyltransferase 8 domain-containing protein 2 isoform X1 n=2 Tax=Anguilla anguilla TaxID=7936 RepID=UPI0015AA5807|nr:glycosyltransferase 8 domain-containing protein 2 isoform X1 [Anguilla anguilla]